MRAVQRSYRLLSGRLFYQPRHWDLTCHHKNSSGTCWNYGAVYQASTCPSVRVDTFCTDSNNRIKAILQPERNHKPYQRSFSYNVSLVTRPRINPYVDILTWSYPQAGNKDALFAYHLHLSNCFRRTAMLMFSSLLVCLFVCVYVNNFGEKRVNEFA